MRQKSAFKQWIKDFGAERLAKRLQISRPAVRHWETGRGLPAPCHMRTIRKLSKGQITYDLIIDGGI